MSRIRSVFTATAILAGSSAALLTGGIAKADNAPPPAPAVPGLNMIQNLLNPANAPQLLQSAAALLTPAPAAPVVAPPPLASAAVTLPQQSLPRLTPATSLPAALSPAATSLPAALSPAATSLPAALSPAATSLPAALSPTGAAAGPSLPLVLPAVPSAAGIPGTSPLTSLIPTGEINLPTVPGLPIPLPHHLTFPDDLAALMPGAPGAAIAQPVLAPAAAVMSPTRGLGTLFPTSALP
jgi:hypothetical protein